MQHVSKPPVVYSLQRPEATQREYADDDVLEPLTSDFEELRLLSESDPDAESEPEPELMEHIHFPPHPASMHPGTVAPPETDDSDPEPLVPDSPRGVPVTYNLTQQRGLIVLGVPYCSYTKRAVRVLAKARLPFSYVQMSQDRRTKYETDFKDQLNKPYKYTKHMPPHGIHTSMPIVMLNGELIGGSDEVVAMIADVNLLSALRKKLVKDCTKLFRIPSASDGQPVPDSLPEALVDAVVKDVDSFRYLPCRVVT